MTKPAFNPNPNLSPSADRGARLLQLDALRGLAAMAVVLYHYTTRFAELYPLSAAPSIGLSYGHYGVNLFFVISGFVILMTLEATRTPMDFVVSRFTRLFPAYWFGIVLTFSMCHALGLPGKLVGFETALTNMLMVHGLWGVSHVDGVYWTLEVELLFYCGMYALYRLQGLNRVASVLTGLLLLRMAHHVLEQNGGIHFPWLVYRLLILQHLPWFALGIAAYLATRRRGPSVVAQSVWIAAMAILTLWVCESLAIAWLAVGFFATIVWAAQGHLRVLNYAPFVWLGSISYPLYLLHENIGWALQLRLSGTLISADMAVVLVLLMMLLLAHCVSQWVEQPAMRWMRQYRSKALAFGPVVS